MAEQLIDFEQVTTERIKQVFDGAFLDTSITKDGGIAVVEGGITMLVSVDTGKQLLRFLLPVPFKKKASEGDQYQLCNAMNMNIVFMKVSSIGSGVVFEYSLPYDGGLPAKQIISAYRWLRKTALGAVQQHDRKGLIA
jgi:hypothetical protein